MIFAPAPQAAKPLLRRPKHREIPAAAFPSSFSGDLSYRLERVAGSGFTGANCDAAHDRLGSNTTEMGCARHVRSAPNGRRPVHRNEMTQRARCVTSRCGKRCPYSIISSARASSDGDTSRPSTLAVLRLTTSSSLVGLCTGSSAGLTPLRMRSAYAAPCRN